MEDILLNGLPLPLPDIKDMDDCVIQEMNFKLSNEDIVNQWDTKIRRKIASKLSVCKDEKVCEDVLKDYLRLLKEQAKNFKEKKVLKEKISCHLKVLHLLCYTTRENVDLYMVNYLDYMESILLFLCNLELDVIRQLKKNHVGKEYNKTIKRVARRLIDNLSVNLLNEEKRIFHVLLKLDSKHEKSWKDVMLIVYNHYLINLPVRDRSDLSFCRYYLLFQKWKNITDKNKHQVMDKIMYLKFDKTPECLTSNRLLKSILKPSTDCLVDLVDVLTNGQQVIINAYFKYIEGRYGEDEICLPQSIELDSDEDDDITQKLLFEPSESEKRLNGLVKSEKQKTPTQENARYVEISSNDGQVVCVIDDDSDIEEVCVQDRRSNRRRKQGYHSASSKPVVSFLDSICLPDDSISSPMQTCTIEDEMVGPPTPPAETTILPIVTAYIDSVRRKGALTDTDMPENSTLTLESLNIKDGQKEVTCLTDVLNVVSCSDNGKEIVEPTKISKTISVPSDSNSVCVQSVASSQNSDREITKEVQSTNVSEKCTCCCKHSANINIININSNISNNGNKQSEVHTNKSVTKPNLKTVEIQTENMDSFNYLCGMITPPSDRTADENSPSSIENICSETEIHSNSSLHNNTNVYAYVPSITTTESYAENSSHNHYDSEVEAHNYTGVCESSTQVYNFDQPGNAQNQSHNFSRENIQDQNLYPTEITPPNHEGKTTREEPINELEFPEEPTNEFENREPEKQITESIFNETEQQEVNEIQMEEQQSEHEFDEELEPENQNEFDETEADTEFNDSCMDEEEAEFELTDTHVDETELVSEIEVHEEELSEVLSEVGVAENEIEQTQEEPVLEKCKDTSETNVEEVDNLIILNKEYQIGNSILENCVSDDSPSIINNASTYENLTNVPIIITNSENTDFQDAAIDIIPFDLINTVILDESYSPDKDIVLVSATDEDGGEPSKFTVFKVAEENLIDNNESNQLNNGCKIVLTQQVLNETEPLIKETNVATSGKIQASVTMAQLVDKANTKTPKNGELVKPSKKKNVEDNGDKIIFTSNERVKSAPLSLFAKFEQSQSDLVENAFSGPIEPLNGRTNISCDNSNSNDSFCLFDSDRSVITKDSKDNNSPSISPEAGSPISPPYENIHAQEYENHMLRVNLESFSTKEKNVKQKKSSLRIAERKEEKKSISDTSMKITEARKEPKRHSIILHSVAVQDQEKKINSGNFLKIPEYKDQTKLSSPISEKISEHKEQKTRNFSIDKIPEYKELKKHNCSIFEKDPEHKTLKRLGSPINERIPEHKELRTLNSPIIERIPEHKEMKKLNSPIIQRIPEYKEMKKLNSPIIEKDPEHKEMKKFNSPIIQRIPEYKELKKHNFPIIEKNAEHKALKRLNSSINEIIPEHKEHKKLNSQIIRKIPEYKAQKKHNSHMIGRIFDNKEQRRITSPLIERIPEYKLHPISFSKTTVQEEKRELNLVTPIYKKPEKPIYSIMSTSASKRKRDDRRNGNKKLKVNFGHTEIIIIPRDTEIVLDESISPETMLDCNVGFDELKLLYREPEIVLTLDPPEEIKRKLHELYVNNILNNLMQEKKVKADSSCIMTRVDYKKPIDDSLSKNRRVTTPFTSTYSYSAASSVPSAISKRVDTPRISGIPPPSGYIPALNSSRSGLKRPSDYSQDNEDLGRYSSDSRIRTRRKRTPTLKAQKLMKPSEPSTSTKVQKRPRGRPRKTETKKGVNKNNPGVLYSDGPFRLG